ncbi:MAG: DNA-processing protein DprA [Ruminococcus sp.]|nr:DNA-processing protein DprA [Ruminococcus sp.]
MDPKDIFSLVTLSVYTCPGDLMVLDLLKKYKTPGDLLIALKYHEVDGLTRDLKRQTANLDTDIGYRVIQDCQINKIQYICLGDKRYPEALMSIPDPPLVIYCKGETEVLNFPDTAAIVGARRATNYSLKAAREFSRSLAASGITVVSGFAKGIDSCAHSAAIEAGGKTIAVLGCGILYDYPKDTKKFKKLLTENGAVISEYPPFAPAEQCFFRVRNRILSGLSKAVLVVQAAKKSGSLNTVSHALEQGREVFVIPPADLFCDEYQGQSALLRDGANPAYSPEDIIKAVKGQMSDVSDQR